MSSAELPLRWQITGAVRVMATVAVLGVVAAAASGHGGLVGVSVPAAVWLVVAGRARREPAVRVGYEVDVERVTEGAPVAISLAAQVAGTQVTLRLRTDRRTEVVEVSEEEPGRWRCTVRAVAWGRAEVHAELTVAADGGAWTAHGSLRCAQLVVEPDVEPTAATFRGMRIRPSYGERVARVAGSGTEFLDVRPWVPGQPLRRLHWPATLRTGEPHVAALAANRNQDVLIVIDNVDGSGELAEATFDRSARAAVGLARAHLGAGDRVALAVAAPDLFWYKLGSGRRHLVALIDTVVDARRLPGFVMPRLDLLPRAALSPGALVIFLSPLLGEKSLGLVGSLRRRGHPTVVIDVLDRTPPPGGSPDRRRALRLWAMEREAMRHDLAARGIVVLTWPAGAALGGVLAAAATRPIASPARPTGVPA